MHQIHIAPMMGYTHRHFRYLMRRFCPEVLLYSEMVTTGALLHGDVKRHLDFDATEAPVVLQLGGHDPQSLARCARQGQDHGYAQINLNVGCPSSRVQEGGIGACLFKSPQLVASCVRAMVDAVSIPVTVKCRIGVDDHDTFEHLFNFCEAIQRAGGQFVVVHARKAWLGGLNPKQNRTVPPLRYDVVEHLATKISLPVVLNGGIQCHEAIDQHLQLFPAVMIGRWACSDPLGFAQRFDQHPSRLPTARILDDYFAYVDRSLSRGERLSFLLQPLQALFHGQPGARSWRKSLNSLTHHANVSSGRSLSSFIEMTKRLPIDQFIRG